MRLLLAALTVFLFATCARAQMDAGAQAAQQAIQATQIANQQAVQANMQAMQLANQQTFAAL
jgi:hypothetical protein